MTEPMPEPTDARRLLDAIDAERAEVERLRAQLHTAREHLRAGVEALTPGRLYVITGEAARADLTTLKDIADMASRHGVRILFLAAGVAIQELESAEIDRLTEELRQQQLRQQLAERQVTDLRAERDAVGAAALDHAWVEATWRAEVEKLRGLLGEALDLALSYMRPVPLAVAGFERLTPPSPAEEQAWREGLAEIIRLRDAGGLT